MTKQLDASDLLALQNIADRRVRVPTSPNLTGAEHKLLADYRRANANGQALISRTAASVAGLCNCVKEG